MEKYELIITEKPQAAMKIAYALADIAPVKRSVSGVPYYEVLHDDKPIVVACAVGHIYGLGQTKKSSSYPIFDIEWKPSYEEKGAASAYTKKYASVISSLAKKASSFTLACDYDVEGEVIGWNVLRFICKQKDAHRMKFSTLTKEDIVEAYEKAMPTIDWGLAYAGETRHYLDYYYGINLSRALMTAMKKASAFKILSIGRVQGPALEIIVAKEKMIKGFVSKKYWNVSLLVSNSHDIEVKYAKDIWDKKEADEFKKLKGKTGVADTETKKVNILPPTPFDLTTLQMEAYKFFGINPSQLLQIAQNLYLAGLISYPRTSSQKLPPSIAYDKIIKKLSKRFPKLTVLAKRDKPIEGHKSDPAHPSIYPTGEKAEKLMKQEQDVYELIVKRFLACFGEDAIIEEKKITVKVSEYEFTTRGSQILKKGWLDIYDAKLVEKDIPTVEGEIVVMDVKVDEKETQPPKRYTQASLVAELTKRNLGTKGTRAMIVDTLFRREYVSDKSIKATALGMSIAESLEKYCPEILDEKLTREFEKEMDSIQTSKKGAEEEKKILAKAQKSLKETCEKFRKNELAIGKELVKGRTEFFKEEKERNTIMPCPVCKQGQLVIKRNKMGRQFLACDKYPECKTTFSLPPYGLIKKSDKMCECGWPGLMAIQKARKPWFFCANPECPTRQKKEAVKTEEE